MSVYRALLFGIIILVGLPLISVGIVWVFYTSPIYVESKQAEDFRRRIDFFLYKQYHRLNLKDSTIKQYPPMYDLRPPRIQYFYEPDKVDNNENDFNFRISAIVQSWNSAEKQLIVKLYSGDLMYVSVNPSGTLVVRKRIDSKVPEDPEKYEMLTESSDKWNTAFCPGDIISIALSEPTIEKSAPTQLFIPKILYVEVRMCPA